MQNKGGDKGGETFEEVMNGHISILHFVEASAMQALVPSVGESIHEQGEEENSTAGLGEIS